jgi:hypothetical protein
VDAASSIACGHPWVFIGRNRACCILRADAYGVTGRTGYHRILDAFQASAEFDIRIASPLSPIGSA